MVLIATKVLLKKFIFSSDRMLLIFVGGVVFGTWFLVMVNKKEITRY